MISFAGRQTADKKQVCDCVPLFVPCIGKKRQRIQKTAPPERNHSSWAVRFLLQVKIPRVRKILI